MGRHSLFDVLGVFEVHIGTVEMAKGAHRQIPSYLSLSDRSSWMDDGAMGRERFSLSSSSSCSIGEGYH